jgi:hypothetical protein
MTIKEDTMFKILSRTLMIAAVAAVMGACTGTPYLNSHWGRSVETAKTLQVANPQAGRQSIKAPEMDGQAAGKAVDSYQRSFNDAVAR